MSYYDFVKDYMKVDECKNNEKYSSAGHTFCWKKENSTYAEGLYWFYEGGSFIIDIHDFYIKEEVVQNSTYRYVRLCFNLFKLHCQCKRRKV